MTRVSGGRTVQRSILLPLSLQRCFKQQPAITIPRHWLLMEMCLEELRACQTSRVLPLLYKKPKMQAFKTFWCKTPFEISGLYEDVGTAQGYPRAALLHSCTEMLHRRGKVHVSHRVMDGDKRDCSLPTRFPPGTTWKPRQGSSSRSHAFLMNIHIFSSFPWRQQAGVESGVSHHPPYLSHPFPISENAACILPGRKAQQQRSEASPDCTVPLASCISKRQPSPCQLGFITIFDKQTSPWWYQLEQKYWTFWVQSSNICDLKQFVVSLTRADPDPAHIL